MEIYGFLLTELKPVYKLYSKKHDHANIVLGIS